MKTKLENVNGKGPVLKAKSVRFEVSIWHWKRIVPAPETVRDFFAEREVDVRRACIRYSRWNRMTREWQETRIWCDIDDLRSLADALGQLNETSASIGLEAYLEVR